MDITYEIQRADQVREYDVIDVNHLLRQLTSNPNPIDKHKWQDVCANSIVMVARSMDGHVVAMATMCIMNIPTGKIAYLQDVVVDASASGQGVGKEIVSRLVNVVRDYGDINKIEFTCSPSRVAANRMYIKLGFQRRDTNNYVMGL